MTDVRNWDKISHAVSFFCSLRNACRCGQTVPARKREEGRGAGGWRSSAAWHARWKVAVRPRGALRWLCQLMPTKPRGVKIAQRAVGKSLVRRDGGRKAGSGNTGGGLVSLRSMGVPLVPLPPRRADASYHLWLAGRIFLLFCFFPKSIVSPWKQLGPRRWAHHDSFGAALVEGPRFTYPEMSLLSGSSSSSSRSSFMSSVLGAKVDDPSSASTLIWPSSSVLPSLLDDSGSVLQRVELGFSSCEKWNALVMTVWVLGGWVLPRSQLVMLSINLHQLINQSIHCRLKIQTRKLN